MDFNFSKKDIQEAIYNLCKNIADLRFEIETLKKQMNDSQHKKYSPTQDLWHGIEGKPTDEKTILMMNSNVDVPPWTGYYDGENFISYETRLPINVSHWKYVE